MCWLEWRALHEVAEHVFRFYSKARSNGLSVRMARDQAVVESYGGRSDDLRSMMAA